MTREGMKQVQNLIDAINRIHASWVLKMDVWADNQDGDMPSLPEMVESRLNHLRGLCPEKAKQFEWMMIV